MTNQEKIGCTHMTGKATLMSLYILFCRDRNVLSVCPAFCLQRYQKTSMEQNAGQERFNSINNFLTCYISVRVICL